MRTCVRHSWLLLAVIGAVVEGATAQPSHVFYSTNFDSGRPPEVEGPTWLESRAGLRGARKRQQRVHGAHVPQPRSDARFACYAHAHGLATARLDRPELSIGDHRLLGWRTAAHRSGGADRFNVEIDGVLVFSHSFLNAKIGGRSQSYQPPPGVLLASKVQLGFKPAQYVSSRLSVRHGLDPMFDGIPHTASYVDGCLVSRTDPVGRAVQMNRGVSTMLRSS